MLSPLTILFAPPGEKQEMFLKSRKATENVDSTLGVGEKCVVEKFSICFYQRSH